MTTADMPFSYTVLRGDPAAVARLFEQNQHGLRASRIRKRDPETGEITTLFDDGTM